MRYGVHHGGCGCHRVFLLLHARQAEVEIIGQVHIRNRAFRFARAHVVVQLIHGVVLRELDARFLIQFRKRNAFVHGRNGVFRSAVAIGVHVADDFVVFVQQHVIHAPGIDAHGCGNFAQFFRAFQAV